MTTPSRPVAPLEPARVRRALPAEFEAVAELTGGVYASEGWAQGAYLQVVRDVAGRSSVADVLVALDGDRVVGAVAVATRGGRFAEQAEPGEAVIRMLVTDPQVRGRGIGAALVEACLATARQDGCTRVLLSTQPEMAPAHRLYERFGFVRTPESDWEPEPGLLLLTYGLDLAGAPGAA